jgi:hypothetical protein
VLGGKSIFSIHDPSNPSVILNKADEAERRVAYLQYFKGLKLLHLLKSYLKD